MKCKGVMLGSLATVLLAGCTSTMEQIMEPALKRANVRLFYGNVSHQNGQYHGTWYSRVNADDTDGPALSQPAMRQGKTVHSSEQSWSLTLATSPADPLNDQQQRRWQQGLTQLQAIASYLDSQQQVPVAGFVRLMPAKSRVNVVTEVDDSAALPLAYTLALNNQQGADSSAYRQHMRYGLAVMGSLYQQAVDAPSLDPVKRQANAQCWKIAARPALALGQAETVKGGTKVPMLSMVLGVFKKNYERHHDPAALQLYAGTLLMKNAQHYMDAQGLSWPQKGSDERSIRASLKFCRAFIAWQGDVTTTMMPLSLADAQPDFVPPAG
ncbi:hypothetical protein [Gallaecimonas sp. GXIMD1310]|uniref:hypothetical protein n=1 Tax=Gallaecimonas sp. GXIMD1310 TaxID=3131926 RepID=UPI00324A3D3D